MSNLVLSSALSTTDWSTPLSILSYGLLDERLLAAARDDNEDLLIEIFEQGGFDINYQDG